MARPKITFNRGAGGLGRPLPGFDHVSGIVFYNDNYPSGFDSDNQVKAVFSLEEAEALGITEDGANHKEEWYQIREYFRLQPKGELWVGIFPVPAGAYDFAEVDTVQAKAEGKVRQIAVVTAIEGVVTGDVTTLQGKLAGQFNLYRPLIGLISFDISGVSDLSTLSDLRTLSAPLVSVVIGQDGNGKGAALAGSGSLDRSVTCIGAALGALSAAKVNESIGWPKKFIANGSGELEVPAFGNGDLVKDTALAAQDSINDKGYLFLVKHEGLTGTYFNQAPTAVVASSDYAFQESNRTIDKAVRLAHAALNNELNGPVEVDPDNGTLSEGYIKHLESVVESSLSQMGRDGEVSGFQAIINPEQDVNSTSTIEVSIEIVPIGVARNLTVNIGFKLKLS